MIGCRQRIQEGIHNSGRVEYIDAIRGFVMIILVMVHVEGFCFNITADMPSLISLLNVIMLPFFFFISGLVGYKSYGELGVLTSIIILENRFRRLIITSLIFFLCFVYAKQINLQEALESNSKAGYWFTYVLFEFLLLYVSIQLVFTKVKKHDKLQDFVFICCGIGFYVATMPSILERIPDQYGLIGILSIKHWRYFIYFVLGMLAKKHNIVFQRLLNGDVLITCCLVIFFLICICWDTAISWHFNIICSITSLSGIALVFNFFRIHSMFFSNETAVGRTLCFIGRRTLDIYFIHYFLLPLNMSHYVPLFCQYPVPIVELLVNAAISAAIIAVSLSLGHILRQSYFLSYLLFGEKVRKSSPKDVARRV